MGKVFVVIDFQNDFVTGSLGFPEALKLDKKILKKLQSLDHGFVFVTKDIHSEDYLNTQEGKNLPVKHCIKGTEGAELYGETGKYIIDNNFSIIEKDTFGSFQLYKSIAKAYDFYNFTSDPLVEIEICGLITNVCVIANAIILKTAFPNVEIIVNSDLCMSFDKKLHAEALDTMKSLQIKVI